MATQDQTPNVGDALVRDKSIVKGFYKAVYEKSKETGELKFSGYKLVAKAETADGENWKKTIEEGYTPFNSNSITRYSIKSLAAFELLIPDEAQRVYVAQAGINYIQSTKQNAKCIEYKDNTGVIGTDGEPIPPEPAYNDDEIDLRDDLNSPPQKRAADPQEKLLKMLAEAKSKLPPEVFKMLMEQQAALASASAVQVQELTAEATPEATTA